MSAADKLKIALALDKLGVSLIEAGQPLSNPTDEEFFRLAKHIKLENARLCAFGMTCRPNTAPENDSGIAALINAGTEYVSVVGKSRASDVLHVLRCEKDENLRIIHDSIAYLTAHNRRVLFDAEHFFAGCREDEKYAMRVLETAAKAGAECAVLCDTNGDTFAEEISARVRTVCAHISIPIGIHCHNDTGCAVACTLAAVDAGAVHVQGTYLGFGERCGNANLSTVIADLQLKKSYSCIDGRMTLLYETASYIADILNVKLVKSMPYVGASAFAHKAGMHIDAMMKREGAFEHIDPAAVGNRRRYLMSDMSGRSTLLLKISGIAPALSKDSPQTAELLGILKEMEHEGWQYEAAEASFELLCRRQLKLMPAFFELLQFKIIGEFPAANPLLPSSAMVKIAVGEKSEITAAEGDGPVHALDNALRRALCVFYPALSEVRLVDYKVRVLESRDATAARVRVLIETTDGVNTWTTVGVSADIIGASMQALTDSMEYKLLRDTGNKEEGRKL